MGPIKSTKLNWDIGTAYDLFVSQFVLHNPDRFSLRANWAAGVRSRLAPDFRQAIEFAQFAIGLPLRFVHDLQTEHKNSAAVIKILNDLSPLERLKQLSGISYMTPQLRHILLSTNSTRSWTEVERETIIELTSGSERKLNPRYLESLYNIWANPVEFSELHLAALQAYVENFFAEEELRILPALKQALSYAQMRAGSLTLPLLLEELTSGVRLTNLIEKSRVTLAPSFWSAPLMVSSRLNPDNIIILFGARPDNMAIIPGDPVPDNLIRGLKSMADPTRLRIMRFLAHSPQTPSQLSRALRLRPPTVNHHLNELRIAGMVQTTVSPDGERQYAARYDGVDALHDLLTRYLQGI